MKRPQHWFSDGVSMQEYLAFGLVLVYAMVALIMATKLYFKTLTAADNEFFWTLSWPVMVILAFYFGAKVAVEFGKSRIWGKSRDERKESGTYDDTPI